MQAHASTIGQSDQLTILTTNIAAHTLNGQQLANLIRDIVLSKDKLFFISHKNTDEHRKEWKLIGVDLQPSFSTHPQCLQTGKFLVVFYIQHPKDNNIHLHDKRYWIEYHDTNTSASQLGHNYKVIQPTDLSLTLAKKQNLCPYTACINLLDTRINIHGPTL